MASNRPEFINQVNLSPNYDSRTSQTQHRDTPPKENQTSQPERFRCVICNKKTQSCCAGCKAVFYCSANHQQIHWETHQFECSPDLGVINEKSNSEAEAVDASRSGRTSARDDVAQGYNSQQGEKAHEPHFGSPGEKDNQEAIVESEEEKARKKALSEAMHHYLNFEYEKAIIKAKQLYDLSMMIAGKQREFDSYQLIADGLLLAKFLVQADKITAARQVLMEIWALAQKYLPDTSMANANKKKDRLDKENKKEAYEQIKKITNVLSSIAGLFSSTGDIVNCEAVYRRYGKVIENNFGSESLETSNYLFLLAVFFLENKQYNKALDTFKEVLSLREKYYGTENNETVADCHYNIAIIYKQTQHLKKALSSLSNALKIRVRVIGEVSLPVAQVLELAAKIHFEEEVYKEAFSKFQDCFIIRKKILNNPKHSDIIRVKGFIRSLYKKMEEVIGDNDVPARQKEICAQIKNQIEKSSLYSDLIKESENPAIAIQSDNPTQGHTPKGSAEKQKTSPDREKIMDTVEVPDLNLGENLSPQEGARE